MSDKSNDTNQPEGAQAENQDGSLRSPALRAPEPKFLAFNLNSSVRVRLNDAGYQRCADLYNAIVGKRLGMKSASDYRDQADAEGYSRFQLWSFMKDFGPTIALGFSPPFNLTVLFEAADLDPVAKPAEASEAEQSPSEVSQ